MKLTKLIKFILLIILLTTNSCAYKDYAKIQMKHIETEKIRMQQETKVVLDAYKIIMKIMFPDSMRTVQEPVQKYLVNHLWFDETGRKHMLQIKDTAQKPSSDKFMAYIMFKELVPALHEIYKIQQLNIEAPVTIGSVLLKAADAIPILGSIAGPIITAGLLADHGVKVAGNTITNGSSLGAGKAIHENPAYVNTWENKEFTDTDTNVKVNKEKQIIHSIDSNID